jgi:protease IV
MRIAQAPSFSGRTPLAQVCLILAALPLLVLLAGCTPLTLSFTFGNDERRIAETEVARDDRAVSGKVALIDVRGTIAEDPTGLMGDKPGLVDSVVAQLKRAELDSDAKAVILRVNSPGGTVTASDVLYREACAFRERTKKPIVISMGEIAASGGYYLSLAGDEILAEPTTLTGSIGVIIPTLNFHDGLGRLGIRAKNIKSGSNKDMIDPLGPPTDAHDALVQEIVNEFYARFRALVVARRPNLDPARLDELTDGRILTGAAAHKAGLVDSLGGVREAFDAAKRLAGLKGARLVKYHPAERTARTPYTPAVAQSDAGSGEVLAREINLLRIDARPPSLIGGGVYYLWPGW